jgi:YVTN family beta-propeller protein
MKHVTFLTYPLVVTGLTALSVGGCSSNATNTSQSSGQSSVQASGSSGTPAAAPKVTATITVGKSPDSVAVDSGAKIVYVTNSGDDTVSVIDAASNAVKTSVKVGKKPEGIAIDSQAKKAVVTNNGDDGSVSIIDTVSNAVVGAPIKVGKSPEAVAVDPASHTAYVGNEGDASVSVIDTAAGTVTATVPVGKKPDGVAADLATHSVYVANAEDNSVSVIDMVSRQVAATIPVGRGPDEVQLVNGSAYVTTAGDNSLSVIDTASRKVIETTPVGKTPDGWVADPGTHTAYITNSHDDSMSVVDAQARKITATVKVGKGPDGIAVDTATHIVYTVNEGDGTVSVILTTLADADDDFALGGAILQRSDRGGGLLERVDLRLGRRQLARAEQPLQSGPLLGQRVGVREGPRAPADPDHVNVVEQQAVYLDGGNLTAGEADNEQPSTRRERAQRVGEPIAPDGVDDHVDAPAVGQLLHRVLESLGQHHSGGAGRRGDLALLLGADHRDGARRPQHRRQPQGRRSDPAGRAMHQHCFAPLQPATDTQREVHGQVVEQQTGTRLEAHVVRQLERPVGRQHRDLGHAAGEHRQADDPVAGPHGGAVGCGSHHPGDLGSQHKGWVRTVLVEAAGEQSVRECRSRGVHVDDDAVAGGFIDLGYFDRVWTI